MQEYEIQDALKDLLGGTIKEMMDAKVDPLLGYEKSVRTDFEYSGRFYTACPVMETGDSGMMETAILMKSQSLQH